MQPLIAHVDMDCFFCACEVKRNPLLKNKPVIVGSMGDRGVVSAANYEARTFGVFSATPISTARRQCPEGIFLPVDFACYRLESRRVMQVLAECSVDIQQVSVDEAYLDVSNLLEQMEMSAIGSYIQQQVLEQTGLSCSVGIAYDKTVAKIASDFKKPFGVTTVQNVKTFLADLPIQKFPGVGKVGVRHYHKYGVLTIGDLMRMNRFVVMEKFGKQGVRYQQIALGEISRCFVHRSGSKSMSRERTFFEDIHDEQTLQITIKKLAEKVYNDLGNYAYKTISIKVRYKDFSTYTRDITLPVASSSYEHIAQKAQHLFSVSWRAGEPIRLLGVKLSNLVQGGRQMSLSAF